MATDIHSLTLRRTPRVWAAMLPAPLLGAAWIIGDVVKGRPSEYLLVDAGVLFGCFALIFGAYALARRAPRKKR
jgi:hypothetical protein